MGFDQAVKNPDVTVRMRGVMEKCTYCTQRIEQAKIAQKVKAGASRATCGLWKPPARFRRRRASRRVRRARLCSATSATRTAGFQIQGAAANYSVLGDLLTKPRTTYLARIRNPNPAMPDYREWPFSFEEYEKHGGELHAEKKRKDADAKTPEREPGSGIWIPPAGMAERPFAPLR
jgi:hypothetical protein